jgi:rRNA maturation protein Rpf1
LLNISQLCDKGYKIMFDHACYLILENDKVLFIGNRKGNVYKILLIHVWGYKVSLLLVLIIIFFSIKD